MNSRILGIAHYLPKKIVSSSEIERRMGLTTGWIEQRTGINSRRFADPTEATSDLAYEAANAAIRNAAIAPNEVGLVLLATSTPDHLLPPTCPMLAARLGCCHAGAMDLAGACSGFVQALAMADSYVRTHTRIAPCRGSQHLEPTHQYGRFDKQHHVWRRGRRHRSRAPRMLHKLVFGACIWAAAGKTMI